MLEHGTIKVVWLGKSEKRICSQMFSSLNAAKKFSRKKNECLIFKLIRQKSSTFFEWEILPFGSYTLYAALVSHYQKHGGKIPFIEKELLMAGK